MEPLGDPTTDSTSARAYEMFLKVSQSVFFARACPLLGRLDSNVDVELKSQIPWEKFPPLYIGMSSLDARCEPQQTAGSLIEN